MKNTLEIGVWQLDLQETINYGTAWEDRLREFEDVLKSGYFNTVLLGVGHLADEGVWQILEKYNVKAWVVVWDLFKSSEQTLEEFVSPVDKGVDEIRKNPKRWEMFNGFAYDENFIRGQSSEEFRAVTKHFYEKYHKRNFPVLSVPGFCDLWRIPTLPPKATTDAFKYVTDVAFDVYAIDVRDGASNVKDGKYGLPEAQAIFPQITDGKSFFKVLTEEMLKLVGHPVNVWFYPSAHAYDAFCSLEGTTRENEDYCLAHLEFFNEYLSEFKHPGGLILYTYAQAPVYPEDYYGLQTLLSIKDENGNQKIRPQDNAVWEKYSARLKEVCAEYRQTETDLILDPIE